MPFRHNRGCPACGGGFDTRRMSDYSYERCSVCLGIWIDWRVLMRLVAEIAPGQSLEVVGSHEGRERPCPDCRGSMGRAYLFLVPIDFCPTREHGIWLDKDELQHILERAADPEPTVPAPPTSFTSLLADFFNA